MIKKAIAWIYRIYVLLRTNFTYCPYCARENDWLYHTGENAVCGNHLHTWD